MTNDELLQRLYALADPEYRDFSAKLTPTVDKECFIGVRTPVLRALAKELLAQGAAEAFLAGLPHRYFEENQLHAFLLSLLRDWERCIAATEDFLPYIDNWATCDQLSPRVFRKHKPELLTHIRAWLASDKTYTVRFGIKMLMEHFLDADFDPRCPAAVAALRSEEYYVKMMQAWYFATALAKQYDAALPYLERRALDAWTHNKAIQKASESFRILPEQKTYLKTLRVPVPRGTKEKTS